jgi:hypothetical protein
LQLLENVSSLVDASGCDLGPVPLLLVRAEAAYHCGDRPGSIAMLVQVMAEYGQPQGHGETLLELWGDRPVNGLAELILLAANGSVPRLEAVKVELAARGDRGVAVGALLSR